MKGYCPYCGASLSENDATCPSCGRRLNSTYKEKLLILTILLIAGLVLAVQLYENPWYCSNENNDEEKISPMPDVQKNEQDKHLLAYWDFDHIADSSVLDMSGSGNDGEMINCRCVEGKVGGALKFVNDSIVLIPGNFDQLAKNSISIECWIYWYGAHPHTYSEKSYIFDARLYPNMGGFILYIAPNATLVFKTFNNGTVKAVHSHAKISKRVWTHVAATLDWNNHKVIIYINGKEDTYSISDFPYRPFNSIWDEAAIGNNRWAPIDGKWAPFNGIIDEVKIFAIKS